MSEKIKPSKLSTIASNLSGLGGVLLFIFGIFVAGGSMFVGIISLICGALGLGLGIKAKRAMTDTEKSMSRWKDGTKTRVWTAIIVGVAVIIGSGYQMINSARSGSYYSSSPLEQTVVKLVNQILQEQGSSKICVAVIDIEGNPADGATRGEVMLDDGSRLSITIRQTTIGSQVRIEVSINPGGY